MVAPVLPFETITPAQALSISATDMIEVAAATGSATAITVLYEAGGSIDVILGGQTVVFGPNLAALTQHPGQFLFDDGSLLYVGGAAADNFNSATFRPGNPAALVAAFGGSGADVLTASGARDVLQGNAGDDVLTGGLGDDTIYGGQDNDRIMPNGGANFAQGNKGDDTISGGGLVDILLGGQGDDRVSGSGVLDGNLGNDTVAGTGQLLGEDGLDTLVSLGAGHDTLSGGNGDDSLVAGSGADSISGDAGADTINGSAAAHMISGGAGADRFLFGVGDMAAADTPKILDWSSAEDTLSFLGFTPNFADLTTGSAPDFATALTMAVTSTTTSHFSFVEIQVGADVYLFAGGANGPSAVVELVGRSLNDFTAHNLI